MPFVRISLKQGKSSSFKKSLSKSVHRALIDEFGIPADDLFQVIGEYDEENIIYPTSYMGIKHTSDIVYIAITAKQGRTVEMKRRLYQSIIQNISESTQHSVNDVIITLVENTEENWSFGNGEAQLI